MATPSEDVSADPSGRRPSDITLLGGIIAVTTLVIGFGVLTGPSIRLVGVLAFLPAAVAALGTVAQTVFAACWAVAGTVVAILWRPEEHPADNMLFVLIMAVSGVLAVLACRYRLNREEELLRLRSTADAMQRSILRPLPVVTNQVLVRGVYEPVHEDKLIGGDIYDVAATPFGTRVLIGDVQGKGLAAIGLGFAVLGAFREAAHREPTLTALVDALEDAVVRHNADVARVGEPERFVTALLLGIDDGPDVQAVSCGHPEPHVIEPGTAVPVPLNEVDLPLGLAALSPEPRTVSWFDFPSGTTLLLCTDGVTEARSPDGAFFPLEDQLAASTTLNADELAHHLHRQSRAFAKGPQQDDIAVLTLRRTPPRPHVSPT
ncbi:PP2C family protein-serine/threonine phosphatase [Streptomyces justiciae]|uniref:PP2C family protein-serine/threonine phosphatase n=1 Tax=Streptomyces justiciae TaxID=2780140 RepID=UPI00211826F5|nr:PP2C family protein-serine/threonine phosphatase [Streptomyces justiciae]MCW8379759.1 serine/threonine-protein phosphatase [Streptomyces justiciae]